MNQGPLDLQSNALPLSYTPTSVVAVTYGGIYGSHSIVMNTVVVCSSIAGIPLMSWQFSWNKCTISSPSLKETLSYSLLLLKEGK